MTEIEALRHDAAALSAFVERVSSHCKTGDHPSYASSSEELFAYISALALSTQQYVYDLVSTIDPAAAKSNPQTFYLQTQVLGTLRFSWFQLHRFVKPAAEADTLHAPNALMDALTRSLQKLPGFADVRFSVLHSTDLNYFQINSNYLRDLATEISVIVGASTPFPQDLGVVAFPYSQSAAIFSNVLLAHEMGHFAFQRGKEAQALEKAALSKLQASNKAIALGPLLIWCKDRILSWCEEIFCDLFALALVGPCFSLAYIELFSLTRNVALAYGGGIPGIPNPHIQFASSHPANALRLREHVRFMRAEMAGWWEELALDSNHMIDLLEKSAALGDAEFSFSVSGMSPDATSLSLEVFIDMIPDLHRIVANTFSGKQLGVDSFKRDRSLIQRYLGHAIVPSTLTEDGGHRRPSQLDVLNASYLFYLNNLDDLILSVRGCDPNDLRTRSYWSSRLESWTAKALDDLRT